MTQEFQFKPRLEAYPMKWDDLLPPVRRAVAELLILIDGAERINERENGKEKEVANCFLVSGIRGTGKTTVLLSAKDMVCSSVKRPAESKQSASPDEKLENAVNESVSYLKEKYVVWLPILNLEPLIPNSNLLTAVLTRVCNAIEQTGCTHLTSIFEEGPDSARQLFRKLIQNASLIWEDIQEADTRGKATRQIAIADIYANFRNDFQKAMDALSIQLSRVYGSKDNGCSVVLPVDNINCSTDHLRSIVKLSQLVSHSRLWLIMAGDQEDIEAFLERAYWKELIFNKNSNSVRDKRRWDGEDEVLVMARRQAASTYQKLFPPSHRIEIDCVKPDATLEFKPCNERDSIKDLLIKIYVSLKEEEEDKIPFADLLGVEIEDPNKPNPGKLNEAVATHLASQGLNLPARVVLDLWQLAYDIVKNETTEEKREEKRQAEKLAKSMLRNAIFRSNMSSRLGEYLQNKIIRRTSNGGTLLSFENVKLEVLHSRKAELELPIGEPQRKSNKFGCARSTLSICRLADIDIAIIRPEEISKELPDDLPKDVAAWLSILYDILILIPELAVINGVKIENGFINITHETCMTDHHTKKHHVWWPAPHWNTFVSYQVFWKRWDQWKKSIQNCLKEESKDDALLLRLLVAGWVKCVLETFIDLNQHKKDQPVFKELNDFFSKIPAKTFKKLMEEKDTEKYDEFEKSVIATTHKTYAAIRSSQTRAFIAREPIKDWLEKGLPLLFSYLYVPLENNTCLAELYCPKKAGDNETAGKDKKEPNLREYWKKNWPFFLADLDAQLENLFPKDKVLSESSDSDEEKYKQYIDSLGHFGTLHRYWENVSDCGSKG